VSTLRTWFSRLGKLFGKERHDRELAEELESHLQMHVETNVRTGMSPEEATRQALVKLGGVEQTKENYRDVGADLGPPERRGGRHRGQAAEIF